MHFSQSIMDAVKLTTDTLPVAERHIMFFPVSFWRPIFKIHLICEGQKFFAIHWIVHIPLPAFHGSVIVHTLPICSYIVWQTEHYEQNSNPTLSTHFNVSLVSQSVSPSGARGVQGFRMETCDPPQRDTLMLTHLTCARRDRWNHFSTAVHKIEIIAIR